METQTYSILVVDDSPADLYIIQEAFSDCGFTYHLELASSPDEALQLLSRENFHLLLSDFGADADDGRAFIRSVRARQPSLPIIVLSGNHYSTAAYESGANVFVRKPNNLPEFIAKMQAIMQFWVDVAELPTPMYLNQKAYIA